MNHVERFRAVMSFQPVDRLPMWEWAMWWDKTIDRMIGDEQLPEDSKRNPNGTLAEWPAWLLEGKPSPTGRVTLTSWRLWKKGEPLLESGLLGPVTLRAAERMDAK